MHFAVAGLRDVAQTISCALLQFLDCSNDKVVFYICVAMPQQRGTQYIIKDLREVIVRDPCSARLDWHSDISVS